MPTAAHASGRVLLMLAVTASLLAPQRAWAAGFTIPLIGARMSGQAAFSAHPDDASAVYHNPAGLALLHDRLRVDLSGTGILTNTAYQRVDYPQQPGAPGTFDTSKPPAGTCPEEGATTGYDPAGYVLSACRRLSVAPASHWGTIPFLALASNPGWADLAFGLGVYSPHNATAEFPAGGAQRYSVIEGQITTLYVTPTLAWRPHPAVALGAGVSYIRASASFERAFWLPAMLRLLNPTEITMTLDAAGQTFGWDAGLILLPGKIVPQLAGLELAVTYVSRAALDFDGTLDVRGASALLGGIFQPGYEEGEVIRRDATASFTVPDVLKLGLGYEVGPQLWLGADLYFNHYSLYDNLTIELDQPLGSLEEFRDEKKSVNAWSLAVGGRWTPLQPLDVRLGLFLDQTPYPDEYYSILSPDADKLGVSSGLSFRVAGGVELDLSYMALFYKDRIVSTSQVRPRFDSDAPLPIHEQAPFSGNGEVVDKLVHVFGAQLAWSWESPAPPVASGDAPPAAAEPRSP